MPPTPTISAPVDGTPVRYGQIVNFHGSATDPDDGTLPASALGWTVLLHHNSHVHTFVSGTGSSGSFMAEDHGDIGTFAYEIVLTATDSTGLKSSTSVTLPVAHDITLPSAPTGLAATVAGSGQVALTWVAPFDGGSPIVDYIIQRSPNGTSGWVTVDDGISTASSYRVIGLTNGTRYYFRVFAKNAVGTGAASNTANAIPRTTPGAPSGLGATPGSQAVTLRWNAPATGGSPITDYTIQRSPNGTTGWVTVNDGISTASSYRVTGLTNGTRYYFRVFAKNAVGTGAASNTVNAIPRTTPGAPSGLRATPRSRSVGLSWSAPATGGSPITDYMIQRSPNGTTGWVTVNDGISTASSFRVTGLTNGTRYYFRVFAKNAVGTGAASNTVNAIPRTTPGAPSGLRATPRSRSVGLSWSAPATGGSPITDYVIQRSRNRTTWITVPDGVSTVRNITATRLTPGIRYYFRVAGRNAAGTGAWSRIVNAVPRA